MTAQYYKINPKHLEYKGERYFRVEFNRPKVCQVAFSSGSPGRGKTSAPSISMIDNATFYGNYMGYYVVPCSRKTFERKFDQCVQILKAKL